MNYAKVKILIEGYASADSSGHSCSTITLVQDSDINMIVDPGTVPHQTDITNALLVNNLSPEDINIVYITHSHVDHYRNIGMFKNAKTLDYFGWWIGDVFEDYSDPSENIKMIYTPGHSIDGTTLLVKLQFAVMYFGKKIFPKKIPLRLICPSSRIVAILFYQMRIILFRVMEKSLK